MLLLIDRWIDMMQLASQPASEPSLAQLAQLAQLMILISERFFFLFVLFFVVVVFLRGEREREGGREEGRMLASRSLLM